MTLLPTLVRAILICLTTLALTLAKGPSAQAVGIPDGAGSVSPAQSVGMTNPCPGNLDARQYTYTYDGGSGEHRRRPTSVGIGVAGISGDFAMTYDAAGAQSTVTYPNGMVATHRYDELGIPTSLDYADGSGQNLLSFSATVDVDGRTVANSSDASHQDYTYDNLGRLTKVNDTRAGQCATRTYGFSAASERTSFASYGPDASGDCQTTTAAVSKVNTYDTANRIRNDGYTYDNLGRTLTTPAADTAPGGTSPLTAAYYANDMAKSMTQTVDDGVGGTIAKETSYTLDPTGRINAITNKAGGTETSRLRYTFASESDAPATIQTSNDTGTSWAVTRYVAVPGLGMAASATNGTLTYQLSNLHGDVVATQAHQTGALTIDSYAESDEYGNAIAATVGRYGWLGVHQRSTDATGGVVLMGVRLYNPVTGHFLSPDPVLGGNVTAYTYPQDPINQLDLDGRVCFFGMGHCSFEAARWTGNMVHVSYGVQDKINNDHGIPDWMIRRAIFHGRKTRSFTADNLRHDTYTFTAYEWECDPRCYVDYRKKVNIHFIINWRDKKAGHGVLITMYCVGWQGKCPSWVDGTPYAGAPGPQDP